MRLGKLSSSHGNKKRWKLLFKVPTWHSLMCMFLWKNFRVNSILHHRKLRRVQDSFSIEVDSWSAIKKLEDCQDLLPENFDTTFKLNTEVDRSKKIAPKPNFITVCSDQCVFSVYGCCASG
eukprot:EG_transcript_33930